jgi:phosphotransferase system HPr (HPr) family protein
MPDAQDPGPWSPRVRARARLDAGLPWFRVDARGVHATLLNAWVPALDARVVVVADGALAADPRRRAVQSLAALDAVEVRVVGEGDLAGALLALAPGARPLVVFPSLEAAAAARAAGAPVDALSVGHVPAGPGREPVLPAVHLGPAERALLARLAAAGVEVRIQPLPDDAPLAPPAPVAPEVEVDHLEVVNERGLHLRAAHALAQLASRLPVEVEVGQGADRVNAKSLLGLATLGAGRGTRLEVRVTGPGAAGAMAALRALFADGFGEGRAPEAGG